MKVKSESEVAQSCPTPSDPMDCSLPGPSVHGIFQARVLEWVATAFSDQVSYPSSKEPFNYKHIHLYPTTQTIIPGFNFLGYLEKKINFSLFKSSSKESPYNVGMSCKFLSVYEQGS